MAFEKFKMNGKTALITGAAGLLGIRHSSALLEAGARVVLTDVNEKRLQAAKKKLSESYDPHNIIVRILDVSKFDSIFMLENELVADKIKVDVLINNAAIDPKVDDDNINLLESSRLENFSLNEWNRQIEIGLTGAFLCSQVFGAAMARNRAGVILNIASDLSVIAPDQRLYRKNGLPENLQPVKPVTYSVIKAGIIGLTRYLASYWAHQGVRCNALSPGGVFNGQSDEFVGRLTNLIPMGRMATEDEYRGAIQFLCSDASLYLNGQNIVIDGGRSVL